MRAFRAVFLAFLVAGSCVASANARILPDLKAHLEFSKNCLDNGLLAQSNAHAHLVRIEEVSVYVDGNVDQKEIVAEAAHLWESSVEGVHFAFVSRRSDADVTVSFAKSLFRQGLEAGGYAKWKRSLYGSDLSLARTTADIELRTNTPDGRCMTRNEMRHCAAHELGHVLGLDDSRQIGDIMAPLVLGRPVACPSREEVAALSAIREEAYKLQLLSLNLEWAPHGYHFEREAA